MGLTLSLERYDIPFAKVARKSTVVRESSANFLFESAKRDIQSLDVWESRLLDGKSGAVLPHQYVRFLESAQEIAINRGVRPITQKIEAILKGNQHHSWFRIRHLIHKLGKLYL